MVRVNLNVWALLVGILAILPSGCARKRRWSKGVQKNDGFPHQIEQAAAEAASGIVTWGGVTLYHLRQTSHLNRVGDQKQKTGEQLSPEDLQEEILPASLGSVFMAAGSPRMGRMTEFIKKCVGSPVIRGRLLALNEKIQRAQRAGGAAEMIKQFKGLLDGALENEELARAHDNYMRDLKAVAQTTEARQALESAERLNEALLRYAASGSAMTPPELVGAGADRGHGAISGGAGSGDGARKR
ncbi:unnamed protein product [Discosporangium mesarthrocarpum]